MTLHRKGLVCKTRWSQGLRKLQRDMAPPQVFVIEMDDGDRLYYAGDTISGRVTVQTLEKKKLRGIYLTLVGRADVCWTETRTVEIGGSRTTTTVCYSNEEPYFNCRVNLWGEDGGKHFLQPGNYQFPFSFKLPMVRLPTSYESCIGQVRYWLEAHMDRPWKFDHVTKRAFTVAERVDLNLSGEDLTASRHAENQKTLGFWCCATGPLTLTAATDHTGYCPGENILVTAHVENNTNRVMRGATVTLCRHVQCFVRGHHRGWREFVAEIQTNDPIPASCNFEWNQEPLSIPPCPPSSHTCKIMHIDYELVFEVVVPTFSTNLQLTIPIVVGTEPLQSVYANATLPTIGWRRTAQTVSIANDRYTMGEIKYAPLFPVLQLPQADQDQPPRCPGDLPTLPPRTQPRSAPKAGDPPTLPPRTQPRSAPKAGDPPTLPPRTQPRSAPKAGDPPTLPPRTQPRSAPKAGDPPTLPPHTQPRSAPKAGDPPTLPPRTQPRSAPKAGDPPTLPPRTQPRSTPKAGDPPTLPPRTQPRSVLSPAQLHVLAAMTPNLQLTPNQPPH